MVIYELWFTDSTNLINAYDNERDALALVLSGFECNGRDITDQLVLLVEDERGETHLIADGDELIERAQREFADNPKTV